MRLSSLREPLHQAEAQRNSQKESTFDTRGRNTSTRCAPAASSAPTGSRSAPTYAPDESLGDYTADPSGEITLWLHRLNATHFEFTVESLPCGMRTVVDSLELAALAEVESLYVGLQAWSPTPVDIRLDDLRIAHPQ